MGVLPPPAPCSSGWSRKSCYGNIDFPTLEWSDARRNCQKLVGDLAKIISAAENQFIYTLIQKQKKYIMGSGWNFTLRQTTSFTGQTTVRSLAIPYGSSYRVGGSRPVFSKLVLNSANSITTIIIWSPTYGEEPSRLGKSLTKSTSEAPSGLLWVDMQSRRDCMS